jgi:hypothetical protein
MTIMGGMRRNTLWGAAEPAENLYVTRTPW